MAAGYLPAPGTQWGPCIEECMHRDCDATRRAARALCRICTRAIGYDIAYFRTDDGYEHALCAYERLENEP